MANPDHRIEFRGRHGRRARRSWTSTPGRSPGRLEGLERRDLLALTVTPYDITAPLSTLTTALLGPASGLTLSGASYVGVTGQGGTYTGFDLSDGGSRVALPDGIVLTNGKAVGVQGPLNNNSNNTLGQPGDADLSSLIGGTPTNDANSLTIRFTAAPGIQSIRFQSLFASAEFPEFVGKFNDPSGVFLDGKQISFDAAGKPLTVNNNFFQFNNSGLTPSDNANTTGKTPVKFDFGYGGLTGALTTAAPLDPSATVHTLKFAVADASDDVLDSALFIGQFSGSTQGVTGAITMPTGTGSTVVVNTADSGPGSLRNAINAANQGSTQPITFAIPASLADPSTGIATITPATPLPTILAPTTLDATSQASFAKAAPGTVLVQIDGRNTPPSEGLVFGPGSAGSVLEGVSIFGFAGAQVDLASDGDLVRGNLIGLPADPATRGLLPVAANGDSNPDSGGVVVRGAKATIGGAAASDRNVISGNLGKGINFTGSAATGGVAQNNAIGTDPTGALAMPNLYGIVISDGAGGEVIGPLNQVAGNVNAGLALFATSGNLIGGNLIGIGASGLGPLGNGGSGIVLDSGSSGNTIGGATSDGANIVSGNLQNGLTIQGGSTRNSVLGNLFGTDASGDALLPNKGLGILITQASGNVIGPKNVVSGNLGNGIELATANGNTVAGNLIGVDALQMHALGNGGSGICVDLGSSGNTIGGADAASANTISGNQLDGVAIQSYSGQNLVLGNLIGTDPSGSLALPNQASGILLASTMGNTIGSGNVISGNVAFGIELNTAAYNAIAGNRIGTNAAGLAALGNGMGGVNLGAGSAFNTIGGSTPGSTNLISGNKLAGLAIRGGATRNTVQSNLIGTNLPGTGALGNGSAGVLIADSPANVVGPGNLVSGNGTTMPGAGIWIDGPGSAFNQVLGNRVGTNLAGSAKLPNTSVGILINEAAGNTVGGANLDQSNLISGNSAIGLTISGLGATANVVQGNLIGTDASGTSRLGNGSAAQGVGLYVLNAPGNFIGGATFALGNVISGNESDGVELFGLGSLNNLIQANRIGTDGFGTGPLGNGQDGVVLDQAPGNRIVANFVASNARNGIFLSGSPNVVVQGNAIGLGLGGQALGNGTFGILIGTGSTGTVMIANNNASNTLGAVRFADTASSAATTATAPTTSKGVKVGGTNSGIVVKVKATSKALVPRPSAIHAQGLSKPKH